MHAVLAEHIGDDHGGLHRRGRCHGIQHAEQRVLPRAGFGVDGRQRLGDGRRRGGEVFPPQVSGPLVQQ
jgi:hypothetical protein